MNTRASSPSAWGDEGTRGNMPHRAVSDRRGRRSRQRASSHRGTALRHLQRQVRGEEVNHGSIRQRFDHIHPHRRGTYNNGDNNNNNSTDDDDTNDECDLRERATTTTHLRQLEQDALEERRRLIHVPRVGRIAQPRPNGVFRWMYCQVNGMAEPKSRAKKLRDI